jgi:hypothetical protein
MGTNSLMVGFDRKTHRRVTHLRGWAAFETFSDAGISVRWPVRTGGTMSLKMGPGLLFVDGGAIDNVDTILRTRESIGINRLRLVVDIHFPLMHPEQIRAFPDGGDWANADEDADEITRAYWTDPKNRNLAFKLIESADAVTTPHLEWAVGLHHFNGNVFVLPDITDLKSAKQFCSIWPQVVAAATGKKLSFMKARGLISAWVMRKELAQHVREAQELDYAHE